MIADIAALVAAEGRRAPKRLPSGPARVVDLRARLDTCQSVLTEVLTLAQQAPGLSDEQLRVRLVALADRAARRLGGEIQ